MAKNDRDWFGFWVHFAFGAFVGALLGVSVWGHRAFDLGHSSLAGVLCISGGALLGGLLAGFGRESFWSNLGR